MQGDNFLDLAEQRRVRRGFRRWVPHIETNYEMVSRKIEGQVVPGREERAYDNVHIFVQEGLSTCKSVFSRTLLLVHGFQSDAERGQYCILLYTFGGKDSLLHLKKTIPVYSRPNVVALGDFLARVSGMKPPNMALIPGFGKAGKNDLKIFFCAGRTVFMAEAAQKRYRGAFRQRSLWIFPECDTVGWEFGTLTPAAIPNE
ncbi:MAG: hypothetical protein JXD19_10345 [Deltaproteobacteria bacterium]|nr:hypothetical protein [Deltaproteobacteria bacterium]